MTHPDPKARVATILEDISKAETQKKKHEAEARDQNFRLRAEVVERLQQFQSVMPFQTHLNDSYPEFTYIFKSWAEIVEEKFLFWTTKKVQFAYNYAAIYRPKIQTFYISPSVYKFEIYGAFDNDNECSYESRWAGLSAPFGNHILPPQPKTIDELVEVFAHIVAVEKIKAERHFENLQLGLKPKR